MSIISLYPATELLLVTHAVFLRNIAKAAFVVNTLAERPQQRYPSYAVLAQALEQFIAEIGDYTPPEVRIDMWGSQFDPYPPVMTNEAPRSDVISLITGDFPSISPDLSTPNSGEQIVARLSNNLKKGSTPISHAPSSSSSFDDTLTSNPYEAPETRVLHRSSASFRTISPNLPPATPCPPTEFCAAGKCGWMSRCSPAKPTR